MKEHCDYESQASRWVRTKPTSLVDLVGRPELVKYVKDNASGKDVVDAGCGEGYMARLIKPYVRSVVGFDLSPAMIECARKQGGRYLVGDFMDVPLDSESCDMYVSSLAFHYLKPDDLVKAYSEVQRVLRPGGKFGIMVFHPKGLNVLSRTNRNSAWLIEKKKFDYEESRGEYFDMGIRNFAGDKFHVALYHSRVEDHIYSIDSAGLKFNDIYEFFLSQKIADVAPALLNDRVGEPLWIMYMGQKQSLEKHKQKRD